MRIILALALVTVLIVPCVLVRADSSPAQITGVTISQIGSNEVVDIHVQGSAQYAWHRLRDPDNRFWIDITGAQLTIPASNEIEPAPLGSVRLRQIDATTVRLALSLTGPKLLDISAISDGIRIVVHQENAADNVVREGTGEIVANSRNVTSSQTIGPTAAQIEAIENGKSPNAVSIATSSPVPTVTPTRSPDAQNTTTNTTQGPTANQIAAMTGEANPTPNPMASPLLTNSSAGWKFTPRGTYVATNPRLIVIDPGHGGSDPGSVRGSVHEAVLTLDMAKRLRDILVARGWEVMMTRNTDVDVYKPYDSAHEELQARVDVGNKAGALLFVSIHANIFAPSPIPSGTTTFYSKAIDVPFATDVQKQLTITSGTKDDGIVKAGNYVTLHSNMPAILIETAFLSNPGDLARLTDPNWRQKVAQGIADGIATYAGDPPHS